MEESTILLILFLVLEQTNIIKLLQKQPAIAIKCHKIT